MNIRLKLELFSFGPVGKKHPLRVELVSDGGYYLKFHERKVEANKCWRPYLQHPSSKVLIVYTEPQFFRIDEHGFVRHQDVNSGSEKHIQATCRWLNHPSPKSSRHFVSSGEADAVLSLTQWFERLGVETEYLCAHHWAEEDFTNRNLVLIGNRRTFPEMAELVEEQGFDFLIQDHHIENRSPNSGERELPDVFSSNKPVKGIVSRFYHREKDSWITAFASNHGRFFEAAVRALTSDQETRTLWQDLGILDSVDPPTRFELIGEARVSPHEEAIRSHSIRWVAKQSGKGAVAGL